MSVNFKQGKTNKAFSKRVRVTRRGKVMARKSGLNHFNARKSRNKQLKQGVMGNVTELQNPKVLGRYMPKSS